MELHLEPQEEPHLEPHEETHVKPHEEPHEEPYAEPHYMPHKVDLYVKSSSSNKAQRIRMMSCINEEPHEDKCEVA